MLYVALDKCMLTCGLPWWLIGKESVFLPMQVRSLGQEDPLEEEMATHFGILT